VRLLAGGQNCGENTHSHEALRGDKYHTDSDRETVKINRSAAGSLDAENTWGTYESRHWLDSDSIRCQGFTMTTFRQFRDLPEEDRVSTFERLFRVALESFLPDLASAPWHVRER
jgi:hypothetical protein